MTKPISNWTSGTRWRSWKEKKTTLQITKGSLALWKRKIVRAWTKLNLKRSYTRKLKFMKKRLSGKATKLKSSTTRFNRPRRNVLSVRKPWWPIDTSLIKPSSPSAWKAKAQNKTYQRSWSATTLSSTTAAWRNGLTKNRDVRSATRMLWLSITETDR